MRRFLLSTEDYLAVERVLLLLGIGAKLTAGYVVETDDPAVTPLLGKLAKMVEEVKTANPEVLAGWPLLVRRSGWVMGAPRMAEEGETVEETQERWRREAREALKGLEKHGEGS